MGVQVRERGRTAPSADWSRPKIRPSDQPDSARRTARAPQRHGGGFQYDFSRVAVHDAGEFGSDRSKISASGGIDITYTPSSSDKSTKIVFIQVIHRSLDGTAVKPSAFNPKFAFADAVTTPAFRGVDYIDGEADPYYNGNDPADSGTQGNATTTPAVNATMNDEPHYYDASFPTGKTVKQADFRTASFSAAGADQGTFYDYIDWSYRKEKGKAEKLTIGSTGTGSPGTEFDDALKLWCKKYGFTLPAPAAAPPVPSPPPSATRAPTPAPPTAPPKPK